MLFLRPRPSRPGLGHIAFPSLDQMLGIQYTTTASEFQAGIANLGSLDVKLPRLRH